MFYPEQVKIYVGGQSVDMRKSFTGLQALVKGVLEEDPFNGSLFVFINRRGNYLKARYWDHSGWCIWAKRLEQGQFRSPSHGQIKQEISFTQFKLLLEGSKVEITRRHKRFALPPLLRERKAL